MGKEGVILPSGKRHSTAKGRDNGRCSSVCAFETGLSNARGTGNWVRQKGTMTSFRHERDGSV